MRKSILLFSIICFPFSFSFAQNDTNIGSPPGYIVTQLRSVKGITADQAGNVWIAFSAIGLAKYDGISWTVYDSLNSGLLNNKILSVAVNVTGVWAGSDTGLYIFDGSTWNRMTVANAGLFSDTISKLYSPGGTEMFTINVSGFSHYNGIAWQHFNTVNSGLVDDTVQCLCKDASGITWAGTKNGLSKFDGSTWQNFTTANSEIRDNDIRSLTDDANHNLFIGTANHGIILYDGNTFSQIRDSVNSYYTFPNLASNLFKLQNGSILQSLDEDYVYSTNPTTVQVHHPGFYASDTTYYGTVDFNDRIWRINKRFGSINLWMRDSLMNVPLKTPPSNYNDLDINQVRCGMQNNNCFHWDLINASKYEVPKGSGKNSVFASGLWIGGLDPSENLHIAAQTYRQSGNDFWPGPLQSGTATIDSATMAQFDSIWKIDRATITEFISQYYSGNVANGNYPVPGIIQTWPAHSSAPFIDHNADGSYNPMDGDYPDMKGDQMLWWVMNDNADVHAETGGIPLGLEIHSSAYAYSCQNVPDSNEVVNYTTFYSFDIINRSDTDYHDVYLGMFTSGAVGNYTDDYVGCNIENDFSFIYNGDNNDEGIEGYGDNPPMMSVALLKGPVAESGDLTDNNHNGIIDEAGEVCMMNRFMQYGNSSDPVDGNPESAQDYYNYLRSNWRNGDQLTYGGNGRGSGIGATNIPTGYIFPGMPYDTGWTESAAGAIENGDRVVLSAGPLTLNRGERKSIDFAYIFTRDESAPNGLNTSVAKNLADVIRIKRWFDTDSFPCSNPGIGINELDKNEMTFSIYPNPATESFTVTFHHLSETATLELYNMLGEKIRDYNFSSGRKEISIKPRNLSKGIYFLKLIGESVSVTKKLIVQ